MYKAFLILTTIAIVFGLMLLTADEALARSRHSGRGHRGSVSSHRGRSSGGYRGRSYGGYRGRSYGGYRGRSYGGYRRYGGRSYGRGYYGRSYGYHYRPYYRYYSYYPSYSYYGGGYCY